MQPFLCNQSRLHRTDHLDKDDCVQNPKHTRENGGQEGETHVDTLFVKKAFCCTIFQEKASNLWSDTQVD